MNKILTENEAAVDYINGALDTLSSLRDHYDKENSLFYQETIEFLLERRRHFSVVNLHK